MSKVYARPQLGLIDPRSREIHEVDYGEHGYAASDIIFDRFLRSGHYATKRELIDAWEEAEEAYIKDGLDLDWWCKERDLDRELVHILDQAWNCMLFLVDRGWVIVRDNGIMFGGARWSAKTLGELLSDVYADYTPAPEAEIQVSAYATGAKSTDNAFYVKWDDVLLGLWDPSMLVAPGPCDMATPAAVKDMELAGLPSFYKGRLGD